MKKKSMAPLKPLKIKRKVGKAKMAPSSLAEPSKIKNYTTKRYDETAEHTPDELPSKKSSKRRSSEPMHSMVKKHLRKDMKDFKEEISEDKKLFRKLKKSH